MSKTNFQILRSPLKMETLNEYTMCEIYKYLDCKDLSNLRDISENFYLIGKLVYLEKFSKSNEYLTTYEHFSFKLDSELHDFKTVKEIVVDVSENNKFKTTVILKDEVVRQSNSILKTVFQDLVYKPVFENLLVLNISDGNKLLKVIEKFPNFRNLKISFPENYDEDDDPSNYSNFPIIKSLAILNLVPQKLAMNFRGIERLEILNTFDKCLIRNNSETLEELFIDHLSFLGRVGYQDKVVLDFQLKSQLKVFNAIGVRCLECEEFLKNQSDVKTNFFMCFIVNGKYDF